MRPNTVRALNAGVRHVPYIRHIRLFINYFTIYSHLYNSITKRSHDHIGYITYYLDFFVPHPTQALCIHQFPQPYTGATGTEATRGPYFIVETQSSGIFPF
jgi:hypothetical protein